jgi:hypothetical protein
MGNRSTTYQHPYESYIGRELQAKRPFTLVRKRVGPDQLSYRGCQGRHWLPGTRLLAIRVIARFLGREVHVDSLDEWYVI